MSKFNVGDKVRVVKARGDDGSLTTREFIGKEGVIDQTGGYYGYHVQFANDVWAFYPDELEAADPTPEARLERAKALVAEIEQEIEDAKPKAAKLTPGAIISRVEYSTMVKLGTDSWATVDTHVAKYQARNANVVVYRDEDIDRYGFEIIREGV